MDSKDKEADKKYNTLKEFEGSRYSGMKVGASHKWYYDQGEWRERKVAPEEWDIYYETTKRRAGKAPEGTGAPVGTEYNWLIIAHQRVDKLDANSYSTCLEGKKFKVAHKRVGKEQWSVKEKTQRKRVIQFLETVINDLKEADENEPVTFTVGEGKRIYGLEHMNKNELYAIATDMDISSRSKMNRQDLLNTIKNNLRSGAESGDKKGIAAKTRVKADKEKAQELDDKSKNELKNLAKEKSIKGHSEMKKEELINALKKKRASQKEMV